jgi:hypothetical protein
MNKSEVIALLMRSNVAVETAMLALQACQTADEQRSATTKESNGMGWNAREASFAQSLCTQIERSTCPVGRRLSARQVECARKMCKGHAGQLVKLGTFLAKPSSVLGIEDRFFRPIHNNDYQLVRADTQYATHGVQAMQWCIQDFDPFQSHVNG